MVPAPKPADQTHGDVERAECRPFLLCLFVRRAAQLLLDNTDLKSCEHGQSFCLHGEEQAFPRLQGVCRPARWARCAHAARGAEAGAARGTPEGLVARNKLAASGACVEEAVAGALDEGRQGLDVGLPAEHEPVHLVDEEHVAART